MKRRKIDIEDILINCIMGTLMAMFGLVLLSATIAGAYMPGGFLAALFVISVPCVVTFCVLRSNDEFMTWWRKEKE